MGYFGRFFGICCLVLTALQFEKCGGQQPCATQEKITSINATVTNFQMVLNDILASGNGTQTEKYAEVFSLACTNATYRGQIDEIAGNISFCFDLIGVTNIASLRIGPLAFMDVLLLFPLGGVAEFCDCSPYLPTALALAPMNASYSVVVPSGEYATVGNLPFYCMENMNVGGQMLNIRSMLTITLMGLNSTCLSVPDLVAMSDVQAENIQDFLPMCDTFDPAKFQCALTNSATSEFKTCINNAVGENADCKKYECVKTNIGADNKCGSMADKYYILAVNYDQDTALLTETECDTSAGNVPFVSLSTTVASVVLLLVL